MPKVNKLSNVLLLCAGLSLAVAARAKSLASHTVLAGRDVVTSQALQLRLEGATTAIVFVSARCPCSASHEALLKQMVKEFPEVHFVAVHSNADEPLDESKKHFTTTALPFAVIQDSGAQIATEFGALKTPHVFVTDKNGVVVFSGGVTDSHEVSRSSKNYLRDALLAMRSGGAPEPSEVRSLGCYIARK